MARPTSHDQVNPWIVAITVMTSTFMVVLDTTVVNVSLPHIAGDLAASIDESTWTLTAYIAANAVILPMTGWLGALLGRKRLLMLSIAGFTLTSLLCGLAPSLPVLVVFRILQGAAGGTLQPISQAVLLEAFPPRERGKAMSFWGLGVVVAPILGPVLGGWLTQNYSWRWVFYINIPMGVLALVTTNAFIFDPPYLRKVGAVDYRGLGLLAIGIAALQIMLDKGQEDDWFASTLIVTLAIVAAIGLAWFVIHELTTREPIVDLRVYKHLTYATGSAIMTMVMFVLFASMVLLPVMLQTLLGYSSSDAGWAMAPRGLGSFISMPIVGILTTRIDERKLLGVGLVVGAVTLFWFGTLNLQAGYWDFFWPQFVQGLSLSLLFVPLTTLTMAGVTPAEMANATSLFNLVRTVGGSLGIATATTLLARFNQVNTARLTEHVELTGMASTRLLQQMTQTFVARGADLITAQREALAAVYGMVLRQAAMISFIQVFRIMGLLFVVLVPLLFLLKRPAHHGPTPVIME